MSEKVIVIGAGGHGKVIADIIIKSGDDMLGFLDDSKQGSVMGFPILGKVSDATQYGIQARMIIGVGDNAMRNRIASSVSAHWYTAVHPTAVIGLNVSIGDGTAIMAGAIINASAAIGNHCIINTAAVIEHDDVLGDFVHISPNATLCGTVVVEDGVWIGAGAVVKNNLSIYTNSIIGAGSVVIKNIMDASTYVGIPAKRQ